MIGFEPEKAIKELEAIYESLGEDAIVISDFKGNSVLIGKLPETKSILMEALLAMVEHHEKSIQ